MIKYRVDNLKYFMYKEVSKQAIYFGCGGLLTGVIVGVAVGYGYRTSPAGSNSFHNGSANNYLMRGIVASNCKRGIDGITLMVLKTPQVLNPDDVIIQVRAVGIDMIDTEIAKGLLHSIRRAHGLRKIGEPFILGRECSGVVVDVGSQVQTLEINDRVWAYLPLWSGKGVMSEYVAVPEKFVALKPNNISFEGAATMPYAFITFWQECIEKYQINPNDIKNRRILIHLGLSSKNDGVGLLATQLLKSWGARVTISTEEMTEDDSSSEVAQMTFLHSLKTFGAESHLIIPVDHHQLSNLAQRLFDIVINTDSSKITPPLSYFCKSPNDKVIETFPTEINNYAPGIGALLLSLLFPLNRILEQTEKSVDPPNAKLNECKRLVESRLIVPVVAKSFLPSQYDQAFRHVARTSESAIAHATVGKSVLVFKSTFK
ncbi:reticulon-4-interacting protein 1 homolog, mitochondrial isoform X2 [Folsomia candida]|uniref:reticulon-4-interacting protein 1 homolog, mitochondrial isoform X2 n=1 Tax=Folsomia candida TaxID=158441 RepID=UPI0016051A98|nr:reticulon-4-interacting protein 1 homolog, mitochondrial isoform X2 [Folsomia candida]